MGMEWEWTRNESGIFTQKYRKFTGFFIPSLFPGLPRNPQEYQESSGIPGILRIPQEDGGGV